VSNAKGGKNEKEKVHGMVEGEGTKRKLPKYPGFLFHRPTFLWGLRGGRGGQCDKTRKRGKAVVTEKGGGDRKNPLLNSLN